MTQPRDKVYTRYDKVTLFKQQRVKLDHFLEGPLDLIENCKVLDAALTLTIMPRIAGYCTLPYPVVALVGKIAISRHLKPPPRPRLIGVSPSIFPQKLQRAARGKSAGLQSPSGPSTHLDRHDEKPDEGQ